MNAIGNDARVGRVHSVNVAVDLAVLRAERGGERDRRCVGPTASERRDLALVGHALIPGDDDDPAAGELVFDPVRAHLDDASVEMPIIRDDAGLRAREADRVEAAGMDGDREKRHRDALAGRDEHVELAARRIARLAGHWPSRGALRQLEQTVGGLPHRADHDDDVMAA